MNCQPGSKPTVQKRKLQHPTVRTAVANLKASYKLSARIRANSTKEITSTSYCQDSGRKPKYFIANLKTGAAAMRQPLIVQYYV